jgi:hypothetical protein
MPGVLLLATLAWAAPTVEVVRVDAGPVIDGHLDEEVWARATPVTEFTRFQPDDGGPPAGTTEVRFLQDATTLYVGVRVLNAGYRIRARVSQREQINSDDQIGLYLDPFGDAQSGYILYFNALGIQQDLRYDAGEWNLAWDTVYRSHGRVVDDGYELEIALPFRSLKFPAGSSVQDWGLMITRKVPGEGAKYAFPHLQRNHPRLFTQAATLKGVQPPRVGSGLELIPGLTVRMEATRPDTGSAFTWSDLKPWHDVIRPSLDLRMGLTPNLALVGTGNPDFSQVEGDIAPILTNARFAFRFEERRPFFTEGSGSFDDRHETLYSRSIAEPLYGLKLAGREGRWSIGVLHAVDRSPVASVHERPTPGFRPEQLAEHWASSTMLRLRHDLPGAGWFGLTLADKHVVTDGFRAEGFHFGTRGYHDSLGLDLSVPVGGRWTISAGHDQSFTGDSQDHLGGSSTGLSVARATGEGLGVSVGGDFVSRDYRQELGFRTQSGYGSASASVDWTVTPPGRVSSYTPRLAASVFEEVHGEHYRALSLGQTLVVDGIHQLALSTGLDTRREAIDTESNDVAGWFVDLSYTGQIGAELEWTPRIRVSRELDFRDLTPALRLQAQLDAAIRPARPLRIDLLGRYIRFERADGDREGIPGLTHDALVRARIHWQLSRAWGLRLIGAYRTVTELAPTMEASALLTWLHNPFTAVHVGYAERAELGPEAGALDRSVFAKVQILIRP